MEICGHTGREYDTNNPMKGCGCKIDLDEEDVMTVGAISFCVECYEDLSEADQEWVATEEQDVVFCCKGCDKPIIRDTEDHDFAKCDENNEDDWYCVDCPVPIIDEEEEEQEYDECVRCDDRVLVRWVVDVGYTIADCDSCGLMLCRECLTSSTPHHCQICEKENDDPFGSESRLLVRGWNSRDDFKRARGDWSYYEEPEEEEVPKCPDSYTEYKCPPEHCYDCDESRK